MDSTATAQSQNAPHEPSYHSLSLSEIQENYQALYHELKGSDVSHKLYQTFNDKVDLFPDIEITNCVCLGLGSFTGEEGQRLSAEDVANRENSLHQLVILTLILDPDCLGAKHTVQNLWFQEPGLSQIDENFLKSLGFTTLQFPTALEKITSTTFVFAPRVPYYLTVAVFSACHPAVYIGNRLDYLVQQLSVTAEKHSLDPVPLMVLETLTRFKDASRLVPLPVLEDSPYSWTRVTGIHWLRKEGEGETPAEHGEQEEGLNCQESQEYLITVIADEYEQAIAQTVMMSI